MLDKWQLVKCSIQSYSSLFYLMQIELKLFLSFPFLLIFFYYRIG